jgi:hypothetical protein
MCNLLLTKNIKILIIILNKKLIGINKKKIFKIKFRF